MELEEALDLIQPAIPSAPGVWADLGAGSGIFTRALASVLGPRGSVVAVDRDAAAMAALRAELHDSPPEWAPVDARVGDFNDVPAIASALGAPADGILMANSLHFAPGPGSVLAALAPYLNAGGRIVVVEYDGRPPNPWVPHPVPVKRLRVAAAQAGFAAPLIVGERPSAYGGIMYCAVLESRRSAEPRPL